MRKPSLHTAFQERYQQHLANAELSATSDTVLIEIPFKNPRYHAWISEVDSGFIVGINFLHSHFDFDKENSQDRLESMRAAFEELDDILDGNVAAVGVCSQEKDYIVATASRESAIEHYGQQSKYEIVTFNDLPRETVGVDPRDAPELRPRRPSRPRTARRAR